MMKKQWEWTALNTLIITLILIISIGGMFAFNHYSLQGITFNQVAQYVIIDNTGNKIEKAFDRNLDTAWYGQEGSYTKFNQVTIDLGEVTEFKDIELLLGSDGNTPIDYLITIQSSIDGNRWFDIIGAYETGFFTGKRKEIFDKFVEHKARYIKVGLKVSGITNQKFQVYEIYINERGE